MLQYIMKTNVKRLELFKYGLGAISSLQNYYYYLIGHLAETSGGAKGAHLGEAK